MTVKELKEQLENYDDNREVFAKALIIIGNKNYGYKYGETLNLIDVDNDLTLQIEVVS